MPSDPKDRSLIDQKAQISSDTIIGDSTQVSERTTVKRSVIGRHCIIGKMVKVTGCILLDHCVIEEGYESSLSFTLSALIEMIDGQGQT